MSVFLKKDQQYDFATKNYGNVLKNMGGTRIFLNIEVDGGRNKFANLWYILYFAEDIKNSV